MLAPNELSMPPTAHPSPSCFTLLGAPLDRVHTSVDLFVVIFPSTSNPNCFHAVVDVAVEPRAVSPSQIASIA
jgi:hypothetical protein